MRSVKMFHDLLWMKYDMDKLTLTIMLFTTIKYTHYNVEYKLSVMNQLLAYEDNDTLHGEL